jgi:hypothetical protein
MLHGRLSIVLLWLGAVVAGAFSHVTPCLGGGPLSYSVVDPQDDGTEMQGVWHPAGIKGGLAYLGETAEEEVFIAAFRFSVPDLVQGQKVAFARLRIGCVADRIYEPLRLTIAGVAEDSPAPCSSTRLPSALPKTTTSVAWQLAPSERASPRFFERTSPDIAPIINEILARRGWGASRKSILVVIAPEGAPDGTPDGAPRARGGHVRIQECTGHDRRRGPAVLEIFPSADDAFTGKIMLGRPTDTSITLSAFSLIPLDLFVEYALAAADAGRVTPTRSATVSVGASKPMEMILSGLERDAKYSYRAFWRPAGGVEALFRAGPGCCFHTQRGPGAEFVFTVQADSHMGTTVINKPGRRAKMYKRTLENAVAAEPDFHIDLGDFSRLEVVSRALRVAALFPCRLLPGGPVLPRPRQPRGGAGMAHHVGQGQHSHLGDRCPEGADP